MYSWQLPQNARGVQSHTVDERMKNHRNKESTLYSRIARFAKRHRKALKVIAFLLFFILVWPLNLLGMAPVWVWPVTVKVVDAETGEPLEDVAVDAVWPSVTGTLAGGPYHWGTIRRMQTRTDEKGYFHLSGWVRIGFRNWISETDPEIYLSRAGYWPRTLKNNINKFDEFIMWPEPWISDWNGKVVELEPMHWREWTKEEWEEKGKDWGAAINYWEDCQWLKFPMNIVENIQYRVRKREMIAPNLDVCGDGMRFIKQAKEQCGIDAFSLLSHYGLTEEEWEICLHSIRRAIFLDSLRGGKKNADHAKKELKSMDKEKKVEKRASPHGTGIIMMQSYKVMPDGRLKPLEIEKAGIKRTTPGESGQKHGKGMAGK